MKHRAWWLALIVLALLAAMASLRALSAPPALRTANQAGKFDAVRAKARLARLLGDQRPHPSDSAANDLVQARLVAELRGMGLTPRIDTRFTCNSKPAGSSLECGRVRNVLATVGPAAGKHLLVVSHYDSVPVGPGAGDDGIGVASMLEVAGLVRARPLARPVTFLFNEGEELGLLGARAFLDGDPLRDNVDALLNVEARGVRGPVAMFETSTPNAAAVALYAGAVRHPTSNSLAVSAYRLIPNSTDVTTFAEKKWLALNFAPTANETRYHSAGDDLAALSPATLQHMGDQLLDMTVALGTATTPRQAKGDMLFTDLGGRTMLTLPLWLGWVLVAALIAMFTIAAWRRRALSAVAAIIAVVLGGTALAWVGLSVVGALRHGQFWRAHQVVSEVAVYAGVIAAGLLILGLVRRLDVAQWRAAFWLSFMLFGVAVGVAAPGGLIYYLIPPFLAAAGMLCARWWRHAEVAGALAAALALFLTMGSMLGLLGELFNSGPLWILAIVGSLVLLPWLVEAVPLMRSLSRRSLLVAASALPLLGWTFAAAQPAYSVDRQQQFTIEHITNLANGRARWGIVNDRAPLPAAFGTPAKWRFAKVAYSPRMRWQADAPSAPGPTTSVQVVERQSAKGERRVRLLLQSRGADTLTLSLPGSAGVVSAGPPGRLRAIRSKDGGRVSLFCGGRGCDGAIIDVVMRSAKPVSVLVVGRRFGLPRAAQTLLAARPPFARPQYVPDSMVSMRPVAL